MSFRKNDSNQLTFTDSYKFSLTDRERKILNESWAPVFAEEIFPAIDEEPFSVLYSTNNSRPNTPVNVLIGASIIKELFDLSDDELVENMARDIRYQYALHTTSFEEQPLSDKSLSRFRKRCFEYEKKTGIDLYGDCIKKLSVHIAKLMLLSGRIRRMDSMMISSNIRKLSRTELIYTCVSKLLSQSSASVVTDYSLERNNYSDSQFLKDRLAELPKQKEQMILIVDGAYSGTENKALANEKNIELVSTELAGRKTPDIIVDFDILSDGKTVNSCPVGNSPESCSYSEVNGRCVLSFHISCCAECPQKNKCDATLFKKVVKITVLKASHERAISQRAHYTDRFKAMARLRNGVETIPSILRKRYGIDRMARGLLACRFFAGSKIAALNFRKLLGLLRGSGHYAKNPLVA